MAFSQSSTNFYLEGTTLYATCAAIDGSPCSTYIDLQHLIGNHDGVLSWHSGGFQHTSNNVRLEGAWLCATCQTVSGDWVQSSINLDDHITNDDGQLKHA
jgi:hypothetical protein